VRADCPFFGKTRDGCAVPVVHNTGMPTKHQAVRHAGAHAPKSNHADLHRDPPFS
jgi:hypothetical protein